MSSKIYISVAALIAVICGYISSHSFFSHSWTSIFLWVGVGSIILFLSMDRKSAIYGGFVYGFLTIAVWLITGFNGTRDKIPQLSVIILIASSLCALVGALGAVIFYKIFPRN